MKPILKLSLFLVVLSCSPAKKEPTQQDSIANPIDLAPPDISLDQSAAVLPIFPEYSLETYTKDSTESTILSGLDSIFKNYQSQKYFRINQKSRFSDQTWYFDPEKQLRIVTEQREAESASGKSIYLFNGNQIIAGYSDFDRSGEDTQQNRERILASMCPTCGVKFDAFSSNINIRLIDSAGVNELSKYFDEQCTENIVWLAQAPVRAAEGNNSIFQRGSPNDATFIVSTELYTKFIKQGNPYTNPH
jgi:hypothetical protein